MIEAVPLGKILSFQVEYLHPIIFPIPDQQASIWQHVYTMWRGKFAWTRTAASPAREQLPIAGEPVHHRVPIPIRNIDVAARRNGNICGMAEGFLEARSRGVADREQLFALRGIANQLMCIPIHQ